MVFKVLLKEKKGNLERIGVEGNRTVAKQAGGWKLIGRYHGNTGGDQFSR